MIIGHADKIRMQVRSIGEDGKVWIDSDSFLPSTLFASFPLSLLDSSPPLPSIPILNHLFSMHRLGNEVILFSEDPETPGNYRRFEGATVEAIGAIHFASPKLRSGEVGIKKEQLYLEMHVYGEKKKEQIEKLGIKPGDPILLDRKIKKGLMPHTFTGAYLDNGLGCFATAQIAKMVIERELWKENKLRLLFAFATHEEIGRMGSRVLASLFKPDMMIALDVNHDYSAAPGIADKKSCPLAMGKGFTISHGSVMSTFLNSVIEVWFRLEKTPRPLSCMQP